MRDENDPRVATVLAALETIGAPCSCGSPACASLALNEFVGEVLSAIAWQGCTVDDLREVLRAVLVRIPGRELDDVLVVANEEREAGRRCEAERLGDDERIS